MNRHSFKLSLLAFVLLFFASCTKKNGENNGLNNANKQPFDIMSTKSGSWWLYSADDGSVFYRYATGQDSLVAGLTYAYFYRIDTTSTMREHIPEYFGKNDGKYLSLIDVDGKEKDYITYVILKENPYTGQSWTNTETKKIQGFNVNMYIESNVVNANESITSNGKTYDSIVHVYNKLQAKLPTMVAYTNCGVLEVWFKKGVGIIKDKGNIEIAPAGVTLVKKDYGDILLDYYKAP
ncbi:MAG: hypothetical protein WC716_08245 [Chitinophagaceae bacterium]|jgi:hypothetical protein